MSFRTERSVVKNLFLSKIEIPPFVGMTDFTMSFRTEHSVVKNLFLSKIEIPPFVGMTDFTMSFRVQRRIFPLRSTDSSVNLQ
ncbi:MAG TPA: hypothetical protein VK050_03140 [Flavobacteriaceae bacterium]|nr:hypothetical protein [Flavobacteriaceae bacterium]